MAVAPSHERIDLLRTEDGLRVIAHRTQSDVEIFLDDEDRVVAVLADGERAELVPVDALLEGEIPAWRTRKQAALVKADRPLKTLLEARSRANLPVLVVDDENRLQGLVTEREMIHAILEKRGVDAPAVNGGSA
jgi:ABC-type proline/glycine betaine transport system ATPase subunit